MEALVWAVESRARPAFGHQPLRADHDAGGEVLPGTALGDAPAEADKKRRGLEHAGRERRLQERLDRVADGNPRLMERLDLVLKDKSLDLDALIARMEAVATEFREQVLVAGLAAGLAKPTRQLLAGLLVYEQPVPFEAIPPLFPTAPRPTCVPAWPPRPPSASSRTTPSHQARTTASPASWNRSSPPTARPTPRPWPMPPRPPCSSSGGNAAP